MPKFSAFHFTINDSPYLHRSNSQTLDEKF